MFAICFDLTIKDAEKHHPKHNASSAYTDIALLLKKHGFTWIQGSVYVSENEDMAKLFEAITALKAIKWFPLCVRDIRSFRMEQWSDFTQTIKGNP